MVQDVLGNERSVSRTYPDGSWDCPFCSSPVIAPKETCENPWCVANPAMPQEAARTLYAKEAARAEEAAQRTRDHAAAMRRIEEDREAREAWYQSVKVEAETRKACYRCAVAGGPYRPAKYTVHRGACPRQRS